MTLEESRHPTAGLQHGLVQVQVQPVDPFDVEDDLPPQHLAHRLFYHDSRPRLTPWLQATRRFARLLTEHSLPSLNRGRRIPDTAPCLVGLRRSLARDVTGNSAAFFRARWVSGKGERTECCPGEHRLGHGVGRGVCPGRGPLQGGHPPRLDQPGRRCSSERRGSAAKCCFHSRGVRRWTSRAGWRSMRWRTSTR
jgi:hypothetical protein